MKPLKPLTWTRSRWHRFWTGALNTTPELTWRYREAFTISQSWIKLRHYPRPERKARFKVHHRLAGDSFVHFLGYADTLADAKALAAGFYSSFE